MPIDTETTIKKYNEEFWENLIKLQLYITTYDGLPLRTRNKTGTECELYSWRKRTKGYFGRNILTIKQINALYEHLTIDILDNDENNNQIQLDKLTLNETELTLLRQFYLDNWMMKKTAMRRYMKREDIALRRKIQDILNDCKDT